MKRSVTFLIRNKKGEFLLQLRDNKPNIPYPHYWVFPGGGVEVWEEPIEAVMREMKEELEMEADLGDLLLLGTYLHNGEEDSVFLYTGGEKPGVLHEGEQVQFFFLESIMSMELGFDQNRIIPLIKGL